MKIILIASLIMFVSYSSIADLSLRARDLGIAPGILKPGPLNAITDVTGVRVGHITLKDGFNVNTGVTAIIPADGVLRQNKVAAAVWVGNGYGKMAGISQIKELGEIETPILLTNTLNVAEAIAGTVEWTLMQKGNEDVRSVNAVVGETNDGFLNDIRGRHLNKQHMIAAIESAKTGPVEEGAIGAGTGTVAFGWKGGIGTSSRKLPSELGGWTVGVLVQSNFGGVLNIDGNRIGEKLGQYFLKGSVTQDLSADGSIMIVVATDAPLSDRNLERLAKRALSGLARTGASMTNGSGDYIVAFTNNADTRRPEKKPQQSASTLTNAAMSPLFQAVAEATEEAIYNSLFMAEDVKGHRGSIKALPLHRLVSIMPSAKH